MAQRPFTPLKLLQSLTFMCGYHCLRNDGVNGSSPLSGTTPSRAGWTLQLAYGPHSTHGRPAMTPTTSPEAAPAFRVASLYQFAPFDDCVTIQRSLREACERFGVRGTLIVAPEGINGTIAGSAGAIEQVVLQIRSLPGCADMTVKDSTAVEMPFHRLKVKIKDEIVTMGEPGISPLDGVGTYVAPADWNALISDPETIVIDTRNDYEVGVGTFRNAINPNTRTFREFPGWFAEQRGALTAGATPKIAMFCTGGIRCEKATALLKAQGIEEVYHLQGGILKYLEEVPAEESLWEGECFVFDERVCLTHGLDQGTFEVCRACRSPITEQDKASPLYEEGVSCAACYHSRTAEQRARYAERQRQARLAEERGERHIGKRPNDG